MTTEHRANWFMSYCLQPPIFTLTLDLQRLGETHILNIMSHHDLPALFQLIESTDMFLFLLSSDIFKSEFCRKELFHAIKSRKNIVVMTTNNFAVTDVPYEWKPVESLLTGPKTVAIETADVASLLKNVRTFPYVNRNHFYGPEDSDFYPKNVEGHVTVADWTWETRDKPSTIEVSSQKASRPNSGGKKNPALLATTPLTKDHYGFRIEILKLGDFIGIGTTFNMNLILKGFADNLFITEGDLVLGKQTIGKNCAYFWQSKGIHNIRMHGEAERNTEALKVGSIVDIQIDFDKQKVYFWHNEVFQGLFETELEEGKLYPAVNLRFARERKIFRNHDNPNLVIESAPAPSVDLDDYSDIPRDNFPTKWQWSLKSHKKPDIIHVNGLEISRIGKASNPVTMTTLPFTKGNNYFQVRVVKPGNFVGIGFADSKFLVTGGPILGKYKIGVNGGWWTQSKGTINIMGEEPTSVTKVGYGDKIAIRINFEDNSVSFFKNDTLEKTVKLNGQVLEEMEIFPGVCLGDNAVVKIENVDVKPSLRE